jgi:sugar phosphate isomerase/epimerase
MFAADRSVITTLGEARALAARLDSPAVGVIVDAYHVWWDPGLRDEVAAAARHTLGFHVSDWIVPLPDMLDGRGMMGDGVIDLRGMRQQVDAAGYRGPIEVEIFNQALRARPLDAVLATMIERYRETVIGDDADDASRG